MILLFGSFSFEHECSDRFSRSVLNARECSDVFNRSNTCPQLFANVKKGKLKVTLDDVFNSSDKCPRLFANVSGS